MTTEPPPLSGRRKGFQSGAVLSCDQVARAVAEQSAKLPAGSVLTPDDVMAGVLAIVLTRSCKELAGFILAEGEKGADVHLDLMRKMRARGVRMLVQIMPLENGEGEMDQPEALKFDQHDAEVIAVAEGTDEPCGVLGCELRATQVVRSLEQNIGCWLCTCHAAEVQKAIDRRKGTT